MYADGYYDPPFVNKFRFEINTPFPFHGELHINRTQFDYIGEYFLLYDFSTLRPNFIISVNGKNMCLYSCKVYVYTYCMSLGCTCAARLVTICT